MLCQYQDLFGKVGQGLHSYRLFNIAIVDVILTLIVAQLLANWFPKYSVGHYLVFLFLLGIILHRLFCVRTTIDKWLFPG